MKLLVELGEVEGCQRLDKDAGVEKMQGKRQWGVIHGITGSFSHFPEYDLLLVGCEGLQHLADLGLY